MARVYKRDDDIWKKEFGTLLKLFFNVYRLDYISFANNNYLSSSTVRYWLEGKNCPRDDFDAVKGYLKENITPNHPREKEIYEDIRRFFESKGEQGRYDFLRRQYPAMNEFAGEVLETCRFFAKNRQPVNTVSQPLVCPTGKIQAVVFDFDGTLTSAKTNRTTWENIWIELGYDVKCCQELHLKFSRGQISHEEWCKITEQKFREKNLHRQTIENMASKIHLLKGTRATFKELSNRDIKIYIVSGSIMTIIKKVLRTLYQYVDSIKANEFRYDESGFLIEIIGTKYDFEGKAKYIKNISDELRIAPQDILFVGNSINDQFVHTSGAKTLCINPKLTDISNPTVWNYCIPSCNDLKDILDYL